MKDKSTIKFAIVGCGRIAYRHIEAIQANPKAELVALCDLNLDRARERNKDAALNVYQDYNMMLQKEQIDVVCIMTPSGMHAEHAIDIASRYNKHIVVEKPMALRVSDGENLINVTRKMGVKLFVVHQNRFNKAIQKIKSGMEQQSFGKIVLGVCPAIAFWGHFSLVSG